MSNASLSVLTPVTHDAVVEDALKLFSSSYGSESGTSIHVGSAPGRVNLIGEHTDYNDGFVMPLAIERRCAVVGRRNGLNRFRMTSHNMLEQENITHENQNAGVDPFEGPTKKRAGNDGVAKKVQDTIFEFDADLLIQKPSGHAWHNYVRGVIAQYVRAGVAIEPFDIAIAGNVPLGGGLSSSAALEVATSQFLESYCNLNTPDVKKAQLCQAAEQEFAGVPCGIMDQFISVLGQKDSCMLLDCRSNEFKLVSFTDPNVALIITNTNVKHSLSGGEYAQRRAQCEEAVRILRGRYPEIRALRDATLDQLATVSSEMDEICHQRAIHVITENERTVKAAECLSSGDYKTLGLLMTQSHVSLKNDYEVSCEELDILVDIALALPGVYGARMTGGGFGGCTITLVSADQVNNVMSQLTAQYHERTQKVGSAMVTRPSQGALHYTINA